ncbi:MAG: hypothetical protein GKS06_13740 [Acidobacteria bacterium]|nr:hypothetical protein [Acidobacteriota bacterium]
MNRSLRLVVGAVLFASLLVAALPVQAQDLAAKTERIRELVQARGDAKFLTPAPGSRSTVISVDVSTALFFFLERGSMRGDAIQAFYDALEAGDMEAASLAFTGGAIMTQRATDYGWNGLGVPFTTDSGREIPDILFKAQGGAFIRAETISEEDLANYETLLDAVLAALES